MKVRYQHLETFLIRGDCDMKVTAPSGSNWHLLLVCRVSEQGSESCALLGRPIHDGTAGEPETVVTFEGKGRSQATSLQLTSDSSVAFGVSKRNCVVQLVFGTDSNKKILVEPFNPVNMFGDSFLPEFFREIRKINVRSKSVLSDLCSFLSKHCEHTLFKSPRPILQKEIEDGLTLFLKRVRRCMLSQVSRLISLFDTRLSNGEELKHSDSYILVKILRMFPELSEYVTAFCLHAANQMVFLAILTDFEGVDKGLFNRQLAVREHEETGAIWKLLCYVVGARSVIGSDLLELFSRVIPMSRVHKLLKFNQIRSESQVLARKLSFMSDDAENIRTRPVLDDRSVVAYDWTSPLAATEKKRRSRSRRSRMCNPLAYVSVGMEIFVVGVIAIVCYLLMLERLVRVQDL